MLIVQFAQGTVNTVLSAALKDVAVDLGSSEATLAWAITAPFLAIGIGNPIFGRMGDLRSRRRMYLIGVTVFALCTGGAALAHSSGARSSQLVRRRSGHRDRDAERHGKWCSAISRGRNAQRALGCSTSSASLHPRWGSRSAAS